MPGKPKYRLPWGWSKGFGRYRIMFIPSLWMIYKAQRLSGQVSYGFGPFRLVIDRKY